jgi:ribose transport system substrate-binding protein
VALARNDADRMIEQVQALRAENVGAVVAAPVDAPSLSRSLQQLIWNGVYVGTVVPPPATSLLNAPQYLTGRALAEEAATYIRTRLGGKARVVLLTHDSFKRQVRLRSTTYGIS